MAEGLIKTVLFDIGGVLLTNGWDTASRKLAAKTFGLDFDLVEKRHQLMYSTYELGKISLDTYLDVTYFSEKRVFTKQVFKSFMEAQSKPYNDMLEMVGELKNQYKLQIGVLSNEGQDLSEYRVKWLDFVDFFCISGFVGLRKPDPDIFRLAVNIAQKKVAEIAYVDDRLEFVEIAESLGLKAIHHKSCDGTSSELRRLFLRLSFS